MIWESGPWRNELLRELRATKRRLRALMADGSDTSVEAATTAVEKFAFTTAFIMRKLHESGKLSDNHMEIQLSAQRLSRIAPDDPIDALNWHHLDRFYDFENIEPTKLKPKNLWNYLIHSYVFATLFDDDFTEITGFYVNSDRTKEKSLFCIMLDDYYRLIQVAIDDTIVESRWKRAVSRDGKKVSPRKKEYAHGGYLPSRLSKEMDAWCKANSVRIPDPEDLSQNPEVIESFRKRLRK